MASAQSTTWPLPAGHVLLCGQGVHRKWVGAGAGAEIERERGECDVNDVEPLALCPGVDPEPRWGALDNVDLLKEHRLPLPAGGNTRTKPVKRGRRWRRRRKRKRRRKRRKKRRRRRKEGNTRLCKETCMRIHLCQGACVRGVSAGRAEARRGTHFGVMSRIASTMALDT